MSKVKHALYVRRLANDEYCDLIVAPSGLTHDAVHHRACRSGYFSFGEVCYEQTKLLLPFMADPDNWDFWIEIDLPWRELEVVGS